MQNTDCQNASIPYICKKGRKKNWGEYKPFSFESIPGKVMVNTFFKTPFLHMFPGMHRTFKTGKSQYGYLEGLTKPDCFL